ncbi:MAG: hypothetical protein ACRERE_04710 [Candidatus Entotheonellia bacterium]
MSKWMLHYAQLIAVLAVCTGCSVGMAMSGKEAPNLGAFRVGSPRGQVELQLGSPIASTTEPDGTRTDLYTYELGNEPSAGRAVGHAVMDVLTLGLWEVVGTPIEAFQGQTRRVAITYDRHDRVLALNNPTTPMLTPPAANGLAADERQPRCTDARLAAQCPFFQYREGLYRTRCADGSGLEIGLGSCTVMPPQGEIPHPWQAEGCQLAAAY